MGAVGTVVVLAAGQGKRMRSAGPKVLQPLCGRPMLAWVLDQARAVGPERILVVVGVGREEVAAWIDGERSGWPTGSPDVRLVHQAEQLGTGHAVRCALDGLAPRGTVLVLYGDMPLLRPESLEGLLGARDEADLPGAAPGMAVTTMEAANPRGFGRIVRDESGGLRAIVEERDASPEQRDLREVNVGVYAFDPAALRDMLPRLGRANAQGEEYLTDLVAMHLEAGRGVRSHLIEDEAEGIGVNNLAHLAEARAGVQLRILEEHMANGVRIEDPSSAWIDHGVEIGPGTRILPSCVIRGGVRIGADCEVGPFTHLREGTVLADRAEVGNFTEAKKARLGSGTKAKHLTYLGDVTIGERANIGAGTVVANYDGKHKHHTVIGDRAFVGSGTVLVAPTTVGEGALTGAGAIVARKDIPAGEVWVGVPARPLGPQAAGGHEDGVCAPVDQES
jgi:bifunctional UDP-N-acetylglucosamine pyrophosphorylase/glucosamine-1-phosphate N-acetyltransferase